MKYYFIVCIILVSKYCFAQPQNKIIQEGIYTGPSNFLNGYYDGYYIFKKDATFIYIERLGSDTNFIAKIGKGNWYFKHNVLMLRYKNMVDNRLQKEKIKYELATNEPFDSNYFHIKIMDEFSKPLDWASIRFLGTNKGMSTDSFGLCDRVFSLNNKIAFIEISRVGYEIIKIPINPNFNVHNLQVNLSPFTEKKLTLVTGDEGKEYAYLKIKDKRYIFENGLTLKRFVGDKNEIINMVKVSMLKQSNNKIFLSEIMEDCLE